MNFAICRLFCRSSSPALRAGAVLAAFTTFASAQSAIAVLQTGVAQPVSMAVNEITNKIYVTHGLDYNITVIDGATNTATEIPISYYATAIAVNPVTNKIYVLQSANGLVVIDGATNQTTTIPGIGGASMALNPTTNKIYITDIPSGVTVIDGATNAVTAIPANGAPLVAAGAPITVNSTTNKIYIANTGNSAVNVIDGATNVMTAIQSNLYFPIALDINPAANKIFVVNRNDAGSIGGITVIDGATNQTTAIQAATSGAGIGMIAVNSATNKAYVTNETANSVTVFDGNSNTATNVPVGRGPSWLAVNQATNKIYVLDYNGSGLSVIDGATNVAVTTLGVSQPLTEVVNPATDRIYVTGVPNTVAVFAGAAALQFVPVAPCRAADTRLTNGPFGGPALASGTSRSFVVPNSGCAIPSNAAAYSLNVTVVPEAGLGFLSIGPSASSLSSVSTLNSDGRVKANAAIVQAGTNGAVSVYVSDASHVILDVNGYFVAGDSTALTFFPVAPCRVADTRSAAGSLGGPGLSAGVTRQFPVQSSSCGIPNVAQAYSLNITAVPRQGLGYLAAWPAGGAQPPTSTLNSSGAVTANAAIVQAGVGGAVNIYASDDSDVILDVNGYFAPQSQGGLSLYTVTPCRALDTRSSSGAFSGTLNVAVSQNPCLDAPAAQAFALNVTAVPLGGLSYLTLWPQGQAQPFVSTLNASGGAIASNMAIVPAAAGAISAFATDRTQLIVDLAGYFAP